MKVSEKFKIKLARIVSNDLSGNDKLDRLIKLIESIEPPKEPGLLRLGSSSNPTDAAVHFEQALAEILQHYSTQGLSVSNAVGVMQCVQSDMCLSFSVARGTIDPRIKNLIRNGGSK